MTPQQKYAQKYYKDRYNRLKAEHKCVVCGCELPENAETLKCEACRKKASIAVNKNQIKRKKNKLCRMCGKKLPEGTRFSACFNCRQKINEKRSKKYDV